MGSCIASEETDWKGKGGLIYTTDNNSLVFNDISINENTKGKKSLYLYLISDYSNVYVQIILFE